MQVRAAADRGGWNPIGLGWFRPGEPPCNSPSFYDRLPLITAERTAINRSSVAGH